MQCVVTGFHAGSYFGLPKNLEYTKEFGKGNGEGVGRSDDVTLVCEAQTASCCFYFSVIYYRPS